MGAHDHGSHVSDEPKTPMWLPALGALFFLLAGIWYATRPAEVVADPAATAAPPPPASAVSAMVPAGQGQGAPPVPPPQPRREMPGHEGHGH